jgi:pyruvate, water dikinase
LLPPASTMHINSLFKYWTYRLFAPGVVLRETYDAFRELLDLDSRSHELMADLEDVYYQGKKEDFCRIGTRYDALAASVGAMVTSLERMAPGSFVTLREYYRKFDFYSRFLLAPPTLHFGPPFVLALTDAGAGTPELVGGKSSTLAQLAAALHLPVPPGFVITVNSFHYLLEYNDLRRPINELLGQIDLTQPDTLARISSELTGLIQNAEVPPDVLDAILFTHGSLFPGRANEIQMAVRSSAVNEDGECSFAGQYTTVLDVEQQDLITAYLTVLAGKYSPEALAYRIHSGLSDEETPMAVLVLEMIDALTSGVVYTGDPAMAESSKLFIHTIQGQGEALVSGRMIPQVTIIDRKDTSHCQFEQDGGEPSAPHQPERWLTADQAADLAAQCLQIEAHFGSPQDIEWAMDDIGTVIFLQSRPLQSHGTRMQNKSAEDGGFRAIEEKPLFLGGTMAAWGQAWGSAYCVDGDHPVELVPEGAILVIRETLPSYVQVLHRVSGVLAELGSVAGHFSTVCREFGTPLLCGLGSNIRDIHQGQILTMDAENRAVYEGNLLPRIAAIPLHESQKNLPFYRKLRKILATITPLHLIDPAAKGFTPESCRSLHDIIRFCHEQAVRTMFSLGDRLGARSRQRKKLLSPLPFDIFLVDVGGGLTSSAAQDVEISIEQILSTPFQALWTGLTHASVQWQDRAHFDWKHCGELTMADGIVSTEAPDFASYAVLGGDYVNLIMRFGYHFTLVDALCGEDSSTNYCQFRFAGGGADFSGRLLRLNFISTLLKRAGFQIETRGDLLDARISTRTIPEMKAHLLTLGRLLGATRLMDMALHDQQEVEQYVQDFLAGSTANDGAELSAD